MTEFLVFKVPSQSFSHSRIPKDSNIKIDKIMRHYHSVMDLVASSVVFLMLSLVAMGFQNELSNIVVQGNITTMACEGTDMTLMCDTSLGINVQSAFWGRDDTVTCATEADRARKTPIPCTPLCLSNQTEMVKDMCNKKQFCHLFASAGIFELPKCCPSVMKYLKVRHHCNQMTGQ